MGRIILLLTICILMLSNCKMDFEEPKPEILASLGRKYKIEFSELAHFYNKQILKDSMDLEAHLGLADAHILLFVFGYNPREQSMKPIRKSYNQLVKIDSLHTDVLKLSGIISFLDWDWEAAKSSFEAAIEKDPENLNARHWYSLWFAAMGEFELAMEQSDIIASIDTRDDYLVGRASLLYFQYRFEEMIPLMKKSIEMHPEIPWGYDWLGMAYNGLGDHENSINTYLKAFELSDGTVEIGGGLGHALGDAGEKKTAKKIADYYSEAANEHYLPPVQRSFIHIGLDDYETALDLLEQAYEEKSWFLIFIQTEHWYDPLREELRFNNLIEKMEFPE